MKAGFTSLLLLTILSTVFGDAVVDYYKELGCSPVKTNGEIIKYDCSILERVKEETCFYNGKEYEVESRIKNEIQDVCVAECICKKAYNSNRADWNCAKTECFGTYSPDCKNIYDINKETCCPTGRICDGEETTSGTCEYDGATYMYGEKFYVDDECKSCICGEGFNGSTVAPWCRPYTCSVYIHYLHRIKDGCVPSYLEKSSCCPIPVWTCPSEGDTAVTPKNVDLSKSSKDNVCKFGELQLAIGQKLLSNSDESNDTECTCRVPPHLTCIYRAQ